MQDRFTEAIKEMQDRSPFVCVSCGHPDDIAGLTGTVTTGKTPAVHDRFTEAVLEETERNAFTCESCGTRQRIRKETKH